MSQLRPSTAHTVLTLFMMAAMFATAYFFLGMTWLLQPISSMFLRLAGLLGA